MTGVASQAAGVIGGHNLRECLWSGAVGFVAPSAENGSIELCRFNGRWIVGVLELGSVTCLARDHNVLAQLLLVDHIGVAGFANVMACMDHRAGGSLGNRIPPVMPVLPKTVRYDRGAQHHESDHRDHHYSRQTDQVFRIFEQVIIPGRRRSVALAVEKGNALGYRGYGGGTMIEVTGDCDGCHPVLAGCL